MSVPYFNEVELFKESNPARTVFLTVTSVDVLQCSGFSGYDGTVHLVECGSKLVNINLFHTLLHCLPFRNTDKFAGYGIKPSHSKDCSRRLLTGEQIHIRIHSSYFSRLHLRMQTWNSPSIPLGSFCCIESVNRHVRIEISLCICTVTQRSNRLV